MASMLFTSSPLIAQSSFVKRLRTNSKYSGSSWVPKSSIKVSYCVQQLSYKNISVESSKSSFIQGDGFSAFSLPKSSRVLPISKPPSLNALYQPGPLRRDKLEETIHRFEAKQKGIDKCFKEYEGKILLIVNIPEQRSKWTNWQIKYLNDLYAEYKKKRFEIIGFPYDKKETPGYEVLDNSEEITEKEEIKPQFSLFDKVELNDKHIVKHWYSFWRDSIDQEKRKKDVWYFLRKKSEDGEEKRKKAVWYFLRKKSEDGEDDVKIKYPFQIFLVDREGFLMSRFDPFPGPNPEGFEDPIKKAIEALY